MLDDSTQENFTQEEEMEELERREDEKEIKKDLKKKNDRIQHRYMEKYSQAACKETINNNKEEENNNSCQRRTQKENAERITTKRRDKPLPINILYQDPKDIVRLLKSELKDVSDYHIKRINNDKHVLQTYNIEI